MVYRLPTEVLEAIADKVEADYGGLQLVRDHKANPTRTRWLTGSDEMIYGGFLLATANRYVHEATHDVVGNQPMLVVRIMLDRARRSKEFAELIAEVGGK